MLGYMIKGPIIYMLHWWQISMTQDKNKSFAFIIVPYRNICYIEVLHYLDEETQYIGQSLASNIFPFL